MTKPRYFAYAVRILIATSVVVVLMNMACARGAGVKLLNLLGQVSDEQITIKENVIKGVDFMQSLIIVVCIVGLAIFLLCFIKGIIEIKKRS